jgi:hypothetical protein
MPDRMRDRRLTRAFAAREQKLAPAPAPPEDPVKTFTEQAHDLEKVRKSVEDSAAISGTLWFSYLFTLLYIAIAAGAVTHRDLLLENPVSLPFLNVALPLVAFFALAPVLFIIAHAYTLMHFVMLAAKVGAYNAALDEAVPDPDGNPPSQGVDDARKKAANTPIWQFAILPAEPVYWRPTPHDVLPCFQKTGFVQNQHSLRIGQRLHHIVPHDVAQSVHVPPAAAKDSLLTPRPKIARRFRPHPTGLAPLIPQQSIQEQACRARHTLLREQRPDPRFTSRSDEAQSSSVVSIEAPAIHDLRIMVTHGFRNPPNLQL